MKLTKYQLLVLTQAETDGGRVELTGIDKHRGWNGHHCRAALQLAHMGLGGYAPGMVPGLVEGYFEINDVGRAVLVEEAKNAQQA